MPTYTAAVARPAWVGGTSRTPMGAITDHINPCVTAHSTRPIASTANVGASAEINCDTTRQISVNSNVLRRGHPAVQRTSGTVATAATNA